MGSVRKIVDFITEYALNLICLWVYCCSENCVLRRRGAELSGL